MSKDIVKTIFEDKLPEYVIYKIYSYLETYTCKIIKDSIFYNRSSSYLFLRQVEYFPQCCMSIRKDFHNLNLSTYADNIDREMHPFYDYPDLCWEEEAFNKYIDTHGVTAVPFVEQSLRVTNVMSRNSIINYMIKFKCYGKDKIYPPRIPNF